VPKKSRKRTASRRGQTRGVSCPAELAAEMRKYPTMNWSQVAVTAWRETLFHLKGAQK
jgi:hypothetical protein